MAIGKVYLIGAGPGDPDLITVKGLTLLRRADVVLYDRLIPLELLHEARSDAQLIDVGKVSLRADQKFTQEQINTLIVSKALEGHSVVRLKGGDPFVFGRGGEEALACVEAGIPFEIVPGVSSAVAVPAYAGVPVTQRGLVSAFTVFAGHEDPTKEQSQVDYAALAAAAKLGTLVLLMGLFNLPQIVDQLLGHGLAPDTPAMCIERGTTTQQRVIAGTVATLSDLAARAELKPPVTTVIGAVVTLRDQGLDWFNGVLEKAQQHD